MEILSIDARTDDEVSALLVSLDNEARANDVGLVYSRVDGNSRLLKRGLQQAGFYYAESSYRICHRKVKATDAFDKLIRSGPVLAVAREEHFPAIQKILANDFEHGRIHEDPWVSRAIAGDRYAMWLPDLVAQGHEVYVYQIRDEVIGMHVQQRHGNVADLVLTGVKRSHALLGASLWAAVMQLLRRQDVTEAHTLISAANLAIINLYRKFEFHFDQYLCGYHKRY